MRILLDPPRSAGPVTLGMEYAKATELLRDLSGYRPPGPDSRVSAGYFHYKSGLTISISRDHAGLVDAVEIYRPVQELPVLFAGIPLFGVPADEVISRLAAVTRVELEDDGAFAVAPDLLLALWRPGVPDDPGDLEGRFFQSALVAAPGYYDPRPDRIAEVPPPTPPERATLF
ncbi:hypothetical protein [Actinoplanes solisilvae]|uniref:hypothetical protein n=1 Tax=Actinoplanes solisilvae TaxID=2486853 RepID=UPI000FD8E5C8|nr:hypothetical protein [Actinoplanes solisilvae]